MATSAKLPMLLTALALAKCRVYGQGSDAATAISVIVTEVDIPMTET